jgi:hypothetical protein
VKTALITGANKGIGYEAARQLAAKGFQVFLGARNAEAGRRAADALAKKGAKAATRDWSGCGRGRTCPSSWHRRVSRWRSVRGSTRGGRFGCGCTGARRGRWRGCQPWIREAGGKTGKAEQNQPKICMPGQVRVPDALSPLGLRHRAPAAFRSSAQLPALGPRDEAQIVEVFDPQEPKRRYCVCRNPQTAGREAMTRERLLERTRAELDRIAGSKLR